MTARRTLRFEYKKASPDLSSFSSQDVGEKFDGLKPQAAVDMLRAESGSSRDTWLLSDRGFRTPVCRSRKERRPAAWLSLPERVGNAVEELVCSQPIAY